MPSRLVFVAQEGKLERVKQVLSCADVHEVDEHGASALHQAAKRGHVDVMNYLITQGADANAYGELGRTPLMYAVESGKCEPLEILLQSGASVNEIDKGLEASVLSLAAQFGTSEMAELLLGYGADVLKADRLGLLPVHRAAQHGTLDTLAVLLDSSTNSAGS